MTAEEYFYNHWQKANRSKFGDYGDYNSDEYAIAFANDYAALRIHDVVGRSEQLKAFLRWAENEWMQTPPERQWEQMFDEYFKSL